MEGIDEGFSQYLRQLWQLQELPTDEAIIAWGDAGLPEMNTMTWGTSNQFIAALYYRIFFQVALANEFMRETSDEALSTRNVSAQLRQEIQGYRAEARFLRALSYWHGMDVYGNIPLVTELNREGVAPPPQATRAQIFDFVVSELTAIIPELPAVGQAEYGRADQGAAQMLLAKVYLNSRGLHGHGPLRRGPHRGGGGHQLRPVPAGRQLPAPVPGRQPHVAGDHLPGAVRRAAHAHLGRDDVPGARGGGRRHERRELRPERRLVGAAAAPGGLRAVRGG